MNIIRKIAIASALAFLAQGSGALAQGQPITLEGDVKVVKTTIVEGGETQVELVEPTTAVPGDRLIFGTNYTNNGSEPIEDFVMTNPVPKAVRVAPDADAGMIVSVDGGQNWGRLADLQLAGEDGTQRAATHADITHIRWTLAVVEPGQTGRLEYPAIIR
ncbi:hypothetical protein [Paraurantiacibacter namhicola]|uniref:DUF11 domain-containing protein n=1 Tax=Paraurantiacibacter namhicola TaxID=645517 RepID=A0A1C7DAH4_9SPHN|nr:hypothetical protein [Paraurantiacibacter namhicola]ANU08445.1 hypothetical protein A6F65_02159 [Paraurantiacibacter namhicola]